MSAEKYTKPVPRPHPNSINTGLSYLSQSTMMSIFGAPSSKKTNDCTAVTNPKLKPMIVTQSVGPFRVTGHKVAVKSLADVMRDVKAKDPALYSYLSSAGMLCARLVRGSQSNWSNHSWGFAVDLKIGGKLDAPGDNMVMQGLLDLYSCFRAHGWWWGAEFSREDAMHFEVANETVKQWHSQGLLVAR